jgi:hypothetical protein
MEFNIFMVNYFKRESHFLSKIIGISLLAFSTSSCSTTILSESLPIHSNDEFISLLRSEHIHLQSSSIVENTTELDKKDLIKKIKSISPDFQEFMLDYYFYKTDKIIYLVVFNWYSKRCELRNKPNTNVSNSQLLNLDGGEPVVIDDDLCFIARHAAITDNSFPK